MMAWRSIEFRLATWYSLMLFSGYVALCVTLWVGAQYAVRSAADDLLEERLRRLVDLVNNEADGPEPEYVQEEILDYSMAVPEGNLMQVRDDRNAILYPVDPNAGFPIPWKDPNGQEKTFYTIRTPVATYRILVQDVSLWDRNYTVLLANSLGILVAIRDETLSALLWATPIAFLLSFGGGCAISRRALKPVDEMTEVASAITVTNLCQRISVPETGDALERLSRTFNAMLERLEASVRRIEQFSVDASHELRTPISVIRTTAELALRHRRTESEYRADLSEIKMEAERLSNLIEVLMMLARQGTESNSVPMSKVDLIELAADVTRQFKREAESKGLRLECELPEGTAPLNGNEPALRRLVAALVENALAHTQEGKVIVTVERDMAGTGLRIKDTGEGIPENALGHIFDRFYRVDPSRSRTSGGFGLGLSIAQRIAELHGAALTVESRLGEGSEFRVRFGKD